jgi:FkbM family methyltransferase
MNQQLLSQLAMVEKIATMSKLGRMFHNPYKYLNAIFFRNILYKISRKEKLVITNLFLGKPMQVALPASTDIYLTGGKSHDSEIRLARFLINSLSEKAVFIDIGAHYGYFTLIASHILSKGNVYSFEPTTTSFALLKHNAASNSNIEVHNMAVASNSTELTFYEFDNLHSEYNSLAIDQFQDEEWFLQNKPKSNKVSAVSIDAFCKQKSISPSIIKIDVEGFEHEVIRGGYETFATCKPIIVMEYLEPSRGNQPHKDACIMLIENGYMHMS